MAAPQSDELNFDALDELLRQADALDQRMRVAYPDLYAKYADMEETAPIPAAPPLSGNYDEDPEPVPAQKSTAFSVLPSDNFPDDIPEDIDEDSLQAYFLRRKFEDQPAVSSWERASAGEAGLRISENPAQLPDDELFLYALTKLSAGVIDDANRAIALMEQRPGINPQLSFLPIYTALELGASRERIASLVNRRVSSTDDSAERLMVLYAQRMLSDTIETIIEAETLQEQGYRNRQEALTQAAQNVRARLSRLNY